ncbi:hypothetical protein GWK47_051646 [Chionoecetes opilio]|uniref:Uncharacterized protein n=1 Tax=Chionoecetes opilio TaxID=41210 RepID=A0A8J5CQK7_CHIOP|nr:hypothetical protein GWK47_051646 [Chionoecetes opilio]
MAVPLEYRCGGERKGPLVIVCYMKGKEQDESQNKRTRIVAKMAQSKEPDGPSLGSKMWARCVGWVRVKKWNPVIQKYLKMKRSGRASTSFTLLPSKRFSILAADSPRSRRQSMADTSRGADHVFLDVGENNDEKEKKQRQLNRLQAAGSSGHKADSELKCAKTFKSKSKLENIP